MEKYPNKFLLDTEELSVNTRILERRIKSEITDELGANIEKHGWEYFFREYIIDYSFTKNIIAETDFLIKIYHKFLGKDVIIDDANQYFWFLCFMAYILNIWGIYNDAEWQKISHDDYLEYAKQYLWTIEPFSIEQLGERIHADKDIFLPRKKHLQLLVNNGLPETKSNNIVNITRKKPVLKLVISNE